MSTITPKKYASSLYQAVHGLPHEKGTAAIRSFLKIILRNKDGAKLNKIITAFRQYANEQEGILELNVTTAQALDTKTRELITAHLHRALAKTVVMHETVEPALIGGIVVRYGDTVIDGSIQRQLAQLSHSLKK
ncbi:MAG: ATP synthase F1 subunit delta [Patescibacteria group bacterium]|nr:ATP synthase F1 subunit delta [Patescibacteria group bacterium]MDD5716121.1 ATP synthase F1 subunit delta [Patescibacteria group bacterium]